MPEQTPADADARDRMWSCHADVVDMLRAIQGGRPLPEHVRRNATRRAAARIIARCEAREDL